jgi:hypothetical protein
MPDMLPVPAGEIRHPVAMLILVVTNNLLIHPFEILSNLSWGMRLASI